MGSVRSARSRKALKRRYLRQQEREARKIQSQYTREKVCSVSDFQESMENMLKVWEAIKVLLVYAAALLSLAAVFYGWVIINIREAKKDAENKEAGDPGHVHKGRAGHAA